MTKIIAGYLFKIYMIYSVTADLLLLSGIVWLIIR
jgi:hypothetical protein